MTQPKPHLDAPFVLGLRKRHSGWTRQELGAGLSVTSAVALAQRMARRQRCRCHLVSPDGRVFWISERGRVIASTRRSLA